MKISFASIKNWDCAARQVLMRRRGNDVEFAVVARRGDHAEVEEAGKIPAGSLYRHHAMRMALRFPRLLSTRFVATLPLKAVFTQEWESPLADAKQVKRVLPFEIGAQIPFPAGSMRFDAIPGAQGKEGTRWQVAGVGVAELESEFDFWKKTGVELDALDWEGNCVAQWLRRESLSRDGVCSTSVCEGETVFVAVAARGELLSQKCFVETDAAEREKRIKLFLREWKGAREVTAPAGLEELAVAPFDKKTRLNFLKPENLWSAAKSFLPRQIPSVAVLVALLILTLVLAGK